ncbi:hypothetical protein PV326_000523 [Microctonus aethiopoides]|nr:hypothetical protein PV326_000523 [Microctonus aethiopoides]
MSDTSGKTDLQKLFQHSKGNENALTIEATVDTGLEWQAIDECKEKISSNLQVKKDRGKIYFNVTLDDFSKVVLQLRSIDNIYIVAGVHYFEFDSLDSEESLCTLKKIVHISSELNKCLIAWKNVVKFPGNIHPTFKEYEDALEPYKATRQAHKERQNNIEKGKKKRGCLPSLACHNSVLSYRVTCERNGSHSFESGQAAHAIGGEFQDTYHWIVDLTSYQLEVLCRINNDEVILNLRVTSESLHRRNITHFGPTTLRATVCYNLLRLAKPKSGEIIIDPMCGGGSIPIEAALDFSNNYILGGDNNAKAIERSRLNFAALTKIYKSDLIQWSAGNLPFKDSYVDAFITDMPFGKRMGSISDNRVLYKQHILEMARVLRLEHGRLILLTYDRRSVIVALQAAKDLFHVKKTLNVNIGGLNAVVYVLQRTNFEYEQFKRSFKTFTSY